MSASPSAKSSMVRGRPVLPGLVLLAFALACSDPQPGPQSGSNSNWLRACSTEGVCGESLGCHCGACTKPCRTDADCESLSNAWCVLEEDSTAQALCRSSDPWTSGGMCRPRCQPGTCDAGQVCAVGACTPLEVPRSGECASVVEQQTDAKAQEEQLLDVVERARLDASIVCDGSTFPGAAAVRPDARLFCAARLLAADLAAHGGTTLVDSQGRDTAARMQLAGYSGTFWAEGFGFGVKSASEAWSEMLKSADFCGVAAGAMLKDVGVGVWGGAYVVTMSAE
ncbi:MAG: hypothetical protein JW940_25440 [Polyangiaceae bacterium]|nr:hypothetical protein [Polyangiaceae bacterium]